MTYIHLVYFIANDHWVKSQYKLTDYIPRVNSLKNLSIESLDPFYNALYIIFIGKES